MAEQFTDDFFYNSDIRYFSDVSDSSDDEDPQASAEDKEDETATYCSCGLPATKEMIGCDSGDCEIEWYHYKCVGFTAATLPVGSWMCDRCHQASKKLGTKFLKEKPTEVKKKRKLCIWCGKDFASKDSLKRHQLQVHQNQKMHNCIACKKVFAVKELLKMHYQKCHKVEGVVDCIICGEEFLKARQLQKHHLKHTGEKPFRCDICGKGFLLRWHRKLHKKAEHKDAAPPGDLDLVVISINGQATESHNYAQKASKIFKCGSCSLLFDKEIDLVIHQVDHQVGSLDDEGDLN